MRLACNRPFRWRWKGFGSSRSMYNSLSFKMKTTEDIQLVKTEGIYCLSTWPVRVFSFIYDLMNLMITHNYNNIYNIHACSHLFIARQKQMDFVLNAYFKCFCFIMAACVLLLHIYSIPLPSFFFWYISRTSAFFSIGIKFTFYTMYPSLQVNYLWHL